MGMTNTSVRVALHQIAQNKWKIFHEQKQKQGSKVLLIVAVKYTFQTSNTPNTKYSLYFEFRILHLYE